MSERAVKARLKRLLDSYGDDVWYHMPYMTGMGRPGIPDFTVCCNGHFIAIETKAEPTSKLTKMQERESGNIKKAGGTFLVIHSGNLQEAADTLNELLGRGQNDGRFDASLD